MLLQESTLLRLAERQAGREEELQAARAKAAELEAELADLQREVQLREEQEAALKEVCAPSLTPVRTGFLIHAHAAHLNQGSWQG